MNSEFDSIDLKECLFNIFVIVCVLLFANHFAKIFVSFPQLHIIDY